MTLPRDICKGIPEGSIAPFLLSSLSTTELCLMFLIERDRSSKDIVYRSRKCYNINNTETYCQSCKELLNNLNHFHHLYLKKSCKQFSDQKRKKLKSPIVFETTSLALLKEGSEKQVPWKMENSKNVSKEVFEYTSLALEEESEEQIPLKMENSNNVSTEVFESTSLPLEE